MNKMNVTEAVNQTCAVGCLGEDTQIMMADGSQKRIGWICIGERVYASQRQLTVVNIWKGMEESYLIIKTETGQLILTERHPIWTGKEFVRAKDVKENMRIEGINGSIVVKEVTHMEDDIYVYNLSLEGGEHIMYANGIAVGDVDIQNRDLDEETSV